MNRAVAAGIVVTAAVLVGAACAQAETAYLRRTVPSDTETMIGIGARFDKACRSVGLFEVLLDEPPQHGAVCMLAGAVRPTRLFAGSGTKCLGQPMPGVQIMYRSDPGFAGRDTLRYTLKSPRISKPHQFTIEVRATSKIEGGRRLDVEQPRQSPGPMPTCVALTS
ncbi:hypothetical protein OOZ54_02965 [Rhodopseudomonas palustris]|uniref:hypothetical protein n=1 Tax=Rhodopseudomonas palustris TaxID=1076 RepID=UPI0022F04365|nr:hypothetical protein [Rhodopseudomonas palustris]WBU30477.1 hypothetical protein OOZ54_02965 [Rhodopseudomonas palustris]